jgi:hypothetical protein
VLAQNATLVSAAVAGGVGFKPRCRMPRPPKGSSAAGQVHVSQPAERGIRSTWGLSRLLLRPVTRSQPSQAGAKSIYSIAPSWDKRWAPERRGAPRQSRQRALRLRGSHGDRAGPRRRRARGGSVARERLWRPSFSLGLFVFVCSLTSTYVSSLLMEFSAKVLINSEKPK